MPEKTKMIVVKSARNDGRVALSEADPLHPGGSAFVASDHPVEVAYTPFVAERLRDGHLVEVKTQRETALARKDARAKMSETEVAAAEIPEVPNTEGAELTDEEWAKLSDAEKAKWREANPGVNRA